MLIILCDQVESEMVRVALGNSLLGSDAGCEEGTSTDENMLVLACVLYQYHWRYIVHARTEC